MNEKEVPKRNITQNLLNVMLKLKHIKRKSNI
jgi:hypothetical protein